MAVFETLNLPAFPVRTIRKPDGSVAIYDGLRRKYVAATPEEWVRQHFVNYLVAGLGFPNAFIANEKGIRLNDTARRCDTVIYTRHLQPLCIVEYKRPSVEITAAVFDQIARYNMVLKAPFLIVSNGMKHYCCRYSGDSYSFLTEIPSYDEMSRIAIGGTAG